MNDCGWQRPQQLLQPVLHPLDQLRSLGECAGAWHCIPGAARSGAWQLDQQQTDIVGLGRGATEIIYGLEQAGSSPGYILRPGRGQLFIEAVDPEKRMPSSAPSTRLSSGALDEMSALRI